MFLVLLKFSANRASAPQFLDGHKAWIGRGVADGKFLLVGSLQPKAGGAIMAHDITRADLEARVAEDPFVAEDVVAAEILHIAPNHTDARLSFLMNEAADS